MNATNKTGVATVKKANVRDLSAGIPASVLCSLVVAFVSGDCAVSSTSGTENHFCVTFDKSAHQIFDKEITVPSQTVCKIKNRKEQFIKEAEIICCSDSDSGTDVQSFKTAQPWQDDLSEYKTPMGLLPP
jgi:hypothetical protein